MSQIAITYRCCGATYSMPSEILGAAHTVPALDKVHAEQHPACPPLDSPLVNPGARPSMDLAPAFDPDSCPCSPSRGGSGICGCIRGSSVTC